MEQQTSDDVEPARLDARLDANLHPVTRVYCDENGIIIYERHNAESLPISPGSPRRSRIEALRRADATIEGVKFAMKSMKAIDGHILYKSPISASGIGLTYDEYYVQTYHAALKSREEEKRLESEARDRHRFGL